MEDYYIGTPVCGYSCSIQNEFPGNSDMTLAPEGFFTIGRRRIRKQYLYSEPSKVMHGLCRHGQMMFQQNIVR